MAAVATTLAGCATPPPDDDPDGKAEFEQINDPLEPTNRAIFSFNQEVDTYFLRPVAQGYRFAVPRYGRDRVSDFLDNLKTPLYLANDLLQGNFTMAGATIERFLLNTTFGVAGLMDVADPLGIPGHQSDFGQTMGVWGVGEGPYLVLPLFGPSNPRDAVGMAVESFGDPLDIYLQAIPCIGCLDPPWVVRGVATGGLPGCARRRRAHVARLLLGHAQSLPAAPQRPNQRSAPDRPMRGAAVQHRSGSGKQDGSVRQVERGRAARAI